MTSTRLWRHLANDLATAIQNEPQYAMALRLTLILDLLYGATSTFAAIPVRILCGLMLVFPSLLMQTALWGLLVTAIGLSNLVQWYTIDNHHYLILYWTAACALSQGVRLPMPYLRSAAQWCVALVFLMAATWKIIGREYMDGSFLYATFLMDPRLEQLAALVVDENAAAVRATPEALALFGRLGVTNVSIPMMDVPVFQSAVLLMSWGVVMLELAVGLFHLSRAASSYTARHIGLIGFIFLTYFILPVSGFALVLAILGFAQCREDDRRLRAFYVFVLGCVQVTAMPWQALLGLRG